jgi:hypothetical protein
LYSKAQPNPALLLLCFFVGVALLPSSSAGSKVPIFDFCRTRKFRFHPKFKDHHQDFDDEAQPNFALLLLVFFVGKALISTFPFS